MKLFRLTFMPAAALALAGVAHGEDIDLFVGAPSTSTSLPNVLFVIDNTANWNQAFENEKAALANTFRNLPTNADGSAKFNVGIMLSTETGQGNSNVKGGYVRAAIRPMTSANKLLYAQLIESLDKLADKGDGGYSAITMAEAYYYFSSSAPYAGNNKVKTDYRNNASGSAASRAVYALPGNALSSIAATRYEGLPGTGCSKNFIIFISNGPNQQNSATDALANTRLQQVGGAVAPIALSPSGSQSNPTDEWARFMRQSAFGVVTYAIDVNPPTSGQGPGWSALLYSMSEGVGGGKYTAVSSATGSGAQIGSAVDTALAEIQAVNSVFASVSLPLSVNTQGTYLNQVYVGMFRPDPDALPRWNGNLKQYKLGYVNGNTDLRLLDADGDQAINANTGFVTDCGRSFWTPSSPDDYWAFRPQGACPVPSGSAADLYRSSNSPDGDIVEKGAHAYKLRASSERTMKTCSPTFASCTTLTDFDASNSAVTQTLLGAATATERTALIDWARGVDVDDENRNGDRTETRASIHGDVVHSRPVAINLGTQSTPKVVVLYGGNDGVLRAINGNRDSYIGDPSTGVAPGAELWSFMPPEFYGQIKRIRDNTTQVSFPNITNASAAPKTYGVDGAISAYQEGDDAWVYASMRRGGRTLYAFDIDSADPRNVALKWKTGCPNNFDSAGVANDTGCAAGLSGIGQTWSQPKVIKTAGYGSTPLLIMGGGYDPCEDRDPNACSGDPKGAKVYVFNADTGALVTSFDTERGVVADIAIAPDANGLAQYAYVADLGGNVYRIAIGAAAPASWVMTKIAALGCDSATSCARNRKFMFAPDLLFDSGSYVLLLGSGDREKPRNYSNDVDNHFYMLRDRPTDATWLSSEQGVCGASVLCLASLTPIATSANPSQEDLAAKKGWYLAMRSNEQIVTAAITIFGTVTFSTHQPRQAQAGVCTSDLGIARVYNVSYRNAASENGTSDRAEELPGTIGLPPSPVAGVVTLDDGETVPFCIGCRPESPLEGEQPEVPPSSAPAQPKSRVYWYIQR